MIRRQSREQKHVFDALFVILLFFVFLICALSVVVIGSSVYRTVTENMNEHFTTKTAVSYIVEKVRQNDVAGAIDVIHIDNTPVLQIYNPEDMGEYETLIYVYNGQLMELLVSVNNRLPLSAGDKIMSMESLEIVQTLDGLFEITLVDTDGNSNQILLTGRSDR